MCLLRKQNLTKPDQPLVNSTTCIKPRTLQVQIEQLYPTFIRPSPTFHALTTRELIARIRSVTSLNNICAIRTLVITLAQKYNWHSTVGRYCEDIGNKQYTTRILLQTLLYLLSQVIFSFQFQK